MDTFKKNVIDSFKFAKKDMEALEKQIERLKTEHKNMKTSLEKIQKKNMMLEEKLKAKKSVKKKVAKKTVKKATKKKNSKKSASRDANLVACNQDKEMKGILKYFKRSTSAGNIKVMKELCKQFKANKSIGVKNRENFYKYLGTLKRFTTIQ